MAEQFHELLSATVDHLSNLKKQGVRHVQVSSGTLQALAKPISSLTPSFKSQVEPEPLPEPVPGIIPLDPKAVLLHEIRHRAQACVKCPNLASSRKTVVFGVGDHNSPLMFVGEAPGADEDEQGEPFVGKAGELLNRIISATGLSRETVYIANVLKCRPDTPGQTSGNRKPTSDEMRTCLPYLLAQIDIIKPKVIVALGGVAIEGLFGKAIPISTIRGKFQNFRDIPVMPTYHPAYLLRNQAMSEKRKVWEDMLQVMEKISLPISEKQRSYFLKT